MSLPRYVRDPLSGAHSIHAPDRLERPNATLASDENSSCPFCPGNEDQTPPEIDRRKDGAGDWLVRIVPNRYPAVLPDAPASGAHEVIIEHPDHEIAFEDLGNDHGALCVRTWIERVESHADRPCVALFRNSGPGSGASIAHAHTQLIALARVPERIARIREGFEKDCPVCSASSATEHRVVGTQAFFVSVLSDSEWPFRLIVAPNDHTSSVRGTDAGELYRAIREAVRRIRSAFGHVGWNLFLHEGAGPPFHWFIELTPRLVVVGGFELGTGTMINPASASAVARMLRGG